MENTPTFDDGAAYERFMGRWSRAAGEEFLDWIRPQTGARWLDVGCGGGAFSELVLARCSPAAVCAVDPAQPQIDHARTQSVGKVVEFRVGDAQKLPYRDASFDIVASALVINFVPDRPKAVTEMRRVARGGGISPAMYGTSLVSGASCHPCGVPWSALGRNHHYRPALKTLPSPAWMPFFGEQGLRMWPRRRSTSW